MATHDTLTDNLMEIHAENADNALKIADSFGGRDTWRAACDACGIAADFANNNAYAEQATFYHTAQRDCIKRAALAETRKQAWRS